MDLFNYYFENAKERLSEPHTIIDVHFKRTKTGDNYLFIIYTYNHIEGKNVDLSGNFVSVFYYNEYQLNEIKNYLNI